MPMLHEQIETNYVSGQEMPWVPFAPLSDEVFMKYFRIDPLRGEVLAVMRFPQGSVFPPHYHSGVVIAHTLKGAWRYTEQRWVAKAGDTVYEPAGSTHTPESVGDEECEVFFVLSGDLIFQDEDGNLLWRENWKTAIDRYTNYCKANGVEPQDITSFAA